MNKVNKSAVSLPGRVSAAIQELLARQVPERGIVVWYDPQKTYAQMVKRLALADCAASYQERMS